MSAVDRRDLVGKVVLLGGATGAVGGALAQALLARGARLALPVRSPWQVPKVTARFGAEGVLCGVVGARDSEAAAGFVKGAADALGAIDALICTQGAFAAAPLTKEPAGQLADLIEANVLSAAVLVRAVLGRMQRRRAGSLVFVGSAAVGRGGRDMVHYLAAKAALHEYVRALADELQGTGLRVGALLPGTIDTEANRAAMPTADRSAWTTTDAIADALIRLAFAPPPPGGPLYPLAALR